jgi:TonB family protein
MNRLQKKCFVFSLGLHGLLAVILLGSAAFRNRSEETDPPILSLIPANVLDQAGSGGGQPAPAIPSAQVVAAPQPQIQPVAMRPRTEPQPAPPHPVTRAEIPKPQPPVEETHPLASVDTASPRPAKTHHQHEIHPTFTPAGKTTDHAEKSETSEASSKASARSEARRLNEIENSLDHLASGVQTSAAGRTVVNVEGIGGGGAASARYGSVVYTYYYTAWSQPEGAARNSGWPEARIVVARDGSIITAELVSPSGEATLDKSVRRALDLVKKLPPFPASISEEQLTFRIQFMLDRQQASG